jgi:hypothetical protein
MAGFSILPLWAQKFCRSNFVLNYAPPSFSQPSPPFRHKHEMKNEMIYFWCKIAKEKTAGMDGLPSDTYISRVQ